MEEIVKKTVVIGASTNPERYSNRVVKQLIGRGVPVVLIGAREGEIEGVPVLTGFPEADDVHTVTLYIGAKHQPQYYDYVLGLQPQRVIFNPGAENREFLEKLQAKGVEAIEACNLVMLSIGNF